MIVVAPATRAAMIAARPTAPAPKTAIDEPARTLIAISTEPAPVWIPQPSGPRISRGSQRSMTTALRGVAIACVAKDD